MAWNNQGGGWQGGGGDNRGPWGQGPSGPGGGGGGRQQPPDLEDLLKKGQERLKDIIPGGGGGGGGGGGATNRIMFLLIVLGLGIVWIMNAVYTVEPDEQGVVLRLGEYSRTTDPGLHFILWPIETVETPKVQAVNQLDFGVSSGSQEGLMLAGDQNIVDIRFTVLWKIKDAKEFLFNTRAPEQLVRVVAEAAMREIVGRTKADQVRTQGRLEAQNAVAGLIQETLDSFNAGVLITGVQLEKADPPPAVIDAFEEVQRAEQNQNKFIREAEQYRNKLLGEARGEASKTVEDAKGYKARVVAEADGEAQRFVSVYEEYAKAKDVTRKRLFLETMEDVLTNSNKVIIEGGQGGSGVVPYLPLPEVQKRRTGGESQ
ncbi:MAG: FtsH protease activity modulator HflK [Pseudomonadota bacterium]